MSVTAAILTLLGIVVPFILWLARRRIDKSETREEILRRYEEESRKAIGRADVDAVNRQLDERLRQLNRNTIGQGSDSNLKGANKP